MSDLSMLYSEQAPVLAEKLELAGMCHGDSAEVYLVGAGINTLSEPIGPTTLALCPVKIILPKDLISKGPSHTRDKDLIADEQFLLSDPAIDTMRSLQGVYGFVHAKCLIRTTDVVRIETLEILRNIEVKRETFSVAQRSSYEDYLDSLTP